MNPSSRTQAGQTARRLSRHPWLEKLARVGYAASGLLHLLIGWVAARIALGSGGTGEADQGGALQELKDAPFGEALLWGAVAGLGALALFQLLEGLVGGGDLKDRARALGRAVLYAALGGSALGVARGGRTDGEATTDDVTATLMQAPLGQVLVGGVGLAIVGVAVYHVYKGASKKFLDDLAHPGGGPVGRAVVVSGVVGYVAKGVALLIVGLLFLVAAWEADAEEAGGLDSALRALSGQPFGTVLLLAVGLGLVLYGVHSFARARFERL